MQPSDGAAYWQCDPPTSDTTPLQRVASAAYSGRLFFAGGSMQSCVAVSLPYVPVWGKGGRGEEEIAEQPSGDEHSNPQLRSCATQCFRWVRCYSRHQVCSADPQRQNFSTGSSAGVALGTRGALALAPGIVYVPADSVKIARGGAYPPAAARIVGSAARKLVPPPSECPEETQAAPARP